MNGTQDARFPLGRVHVTERAAKVLNETGETVPVLLMRHGRGDWGKVTEFRKRKNEEAIKNGGVLISVHATSKKSPVRILTRADRTRTVIYTMQDLYGDRP
jgi:hypothetical protein